MATYEELDSRVKVEFVAAALAEKEPEMLAKVFTVCARHFHHGRDISVFCSERKKDGWLEWLVKVDGRITIGVIQRTVGAEFELHS
jgi:hypothetical protein